MNDGNFTVNNDNSNDKKTFTPGPWTARNHAMGDFVTAKHSDGREHPITVAETKPGHLGPMHRSQAEANARLIAAAPELLEALEAFYDATGDVRGVDLPRSMRDAMDKACAAISKALGK